MLSGLIEMAANLGMETVGEGIEEPSQLDMLRSLHCRYAQGFLIARPMPSDRLDEVLFLGDASISSRRLSRRHSFPAPTLRRAAARVVLLSAESSTPEIHRIPLEERTPVR